MASLPNVPRTLQLVAPDSRTNPKRPVTKRKQAIMTPQTNPWHRARTSDASAASEAGSSDTAPQRAAWPPPDPTHRNLVAFLASLSEANSVAFAYLHKGAPYPGTALFEAKDEVKGCGARWVPNARAGEEGQPRGWWSAESVAAVEKLLALPTMTVQTRYGKSYEKNQWIPSCDPDGFTATTVAALDIQSTLWSFRAYESRCATAAVADQRATKEERERALRNSDLHIPPDEDKTVEILRCSPYFVDWRFVDCASTCCANSNLGPHNGLSHALRVLRGLRFNLLEPTGTEGCLGGVRISKAEREREECAIAYRDRAKRVAKRTSANRQAASGSATDVVVHTKGVVVASGTGTTAVPTDTEWEALREERARSDHQVARANRAHIAEYRPTVCLRCKCELWEQFMECSCALDNTWRRCIVCNVAYNDTQRCACPTATSDTIAAVDWETQQAAVQRVVAERMDVDLAPWSRGSWWQPYASNA